MDDIVQLGLDRAGSAHLEPRAPWSLPMPRDQVNNFWYVKNQSDSVVVFIHGIFSDSRNCWLFDDQGSGRRVFWPDLVRTDPRFNGPSIFLAGFDTQLNTGDFALADCSAQVFNALERHSIDGAPPVLGYRSIVFVCHSTGGIVARYLVEKNQEVFRQKAVGFVLLASPSLGSHWANLLSVFARICNQRLGLQLRRGSEILDEVDGRFRDLVDRKAKLMPLLFGMEACEHKLIFRDSVLRWLLLLAPNRGKIVTKLSAGCYFGRVTEIPGTDHFSIVKPDGFHHPSHDFLVTFHNRFTTFLIENGYLQTATENSRDTGYIDKSESAISLASEIRRNLIAAKSNHDLQICRAQAIVALEKHPEDADLILVRDQVEDALSRATALLLSSETASKRRRTRLQLISSGSAIVLLIAFILTLTAKWNRPDIAITSVGNTPVSKGASVPGESEAIVRGTVSQANAASSVYVVYKSAPDMWTASKAQVANDGSWVAKLGRWNDVTSEGSPNTAELSVVVTQTPLEQQKVGTAGEGVFLIPSSRLHLIVGKQSKPLQVAVKPIVGGESLRMDSPLSGSVVQGNEPFEVRGVISGTATCVYVLHRTPQMGVWAAHPAIVGPEGHWNADLGTWNDHNWIHSGVNELIAVAMKPDYCTETETLPLRDGAIERESLSKSPIVRIIVRK